MLPLLTFLVSDRDIVKPHPCEVVVSKGARGTTWHALLSRLAGALKAVSASRRHPRLIGWDMADVRTQERDPLGELARHLTLPPLGF